MAKTPAWQRKEGKDPEGGLNAKGRAAYNKANPGKPGLKAPQPEGGPRRDSFPTGLACYPIWKEEVNDYSLPQEP